MKRNFFSTPMGKITTAVAFIALGAFIAHWYASVSPHESNRVRHRAGYSVIFPDGWSPDMRHGTGASMPGIPPTRDLIYLSPDHYIGPEPSLIVKRLASAIDAAVLKQSGWNEGLFQNQAALVFEKKLKRSLARAALFQRDGQWFEVQEILPSAAQIDEAQWWTFLETFKYPDGPIDPALNRPIGAATEPTTNDAATRPIDF
jgi:hypothetical protein